MPKNTKITRSKRAVLFSLLLVVGFLAILLVQTQQEMRQVQLNRSLLMAVRRNDTRTVIALLAHKADPNARELPSYTSSLWLTLLERLRDPSAKNAQFPTSLIVALYWCKDASGANAIPPAHNFALVKALVEGGANVNISDILGAPPLLLAASRGQRDVVRYLMERGANIDAKDKNGNTPLSYVATWHYLPGDPDILNALLDRGANINGAYHLGTTPLMFALQTGNSNTVRLLLTRHADLNRRNSQGISALSLAQNGLDKEMVALLKQSGAK